LHTADEKVTPRTATAQYQFVNIMHCKQSFSQLVMQSFSGPVQQKEPARESRTERLHEPLNEASGLGTWQFWNHQMDLFQAEL
jgi:hypothetical protein